MQANNKQNELDVITMSNDEVEKLDFMSLTDQQLSDLTNPLIRKGAIPRDAVKEFNRRGLSRHDDITKYDGVKIQLKAITTNEQFSEETNCFIGKLYIEGKLVGLARNDGRGGETYIENLPKTVENRDELIKKAREYCLNTIPTQEYGLGEGFKVNLEYYIDIIIENHLKEKDAKRLARAITNASKKHIVVGIPGSYEYGTYKLQYSVEELKTIEGGKDYLQRIYNQAKKALQPHEEVLNKNLDYITL